MSEQQHEHHIGEVVLIQTEDTYNDRYGRIDEVRLPPPWLPEDDMGYNFRITLLPKKDERFQLTSWFYRHEVRRIEKEAQ